MKASIVILIALGMVAAFCAALLTASMTSQKQKKADRNEPVAVLVAMRDMPSMTIITEDAFEETKIVPTELPAGTISQPLLIVGKPFARPVVKGQPLTRECFALNSEGEEMVAKMPKGKRTMTVELALSSGHEGLLYPGCLVDVLAVFKMDRSSGEGAAVSTTLLQGVEVIAIDSATLTSADGDGASGKSGDGLHRKTSRVTLMVDPRQAEALQLATEHGTVSLAMRNPLDDTETDAEPTLLNQGRLASLAEYLESAVSMHGDAATPRRTAPLADDQPQPKSHAPQRRDITILRGTEVEVRSLVDEPTSAGQVADRL